MKILIAGAFAAAAILATGVAATPAVAQRVVIGPGGVGIGIGARPYGQRLYGGPGVRRGPVYEGRSAYRGEGRGEFRGQRRGGFRR